MADEIMLARLLLLGVSWGAFLIFGALHLMGLLSSEIAVSVAMAIMLFSATLLALAWPAASKEKPA